MLICFDHHRRFAKTDFIFFAVEVKPEVEAQTPEKIRGILSKESEQILKNFKASAEELEKDFKADNKKSPLENAELLAKKLEEKLGPEAYKTKITEYAKKAGMEAAEAELQINESTKEYERQFYAIIGRFYKKTEDSRNAIFSITNAIREGLSGVTVDIEKSGVLRYEKGRAEKIIGDVDTLATIPDQKGEDTAKKAGGKIEETLTLAETMAKAKEGYKYDTFRVETVKVFSGFIKALRGKYLPLERKKKGMPPKEYEKYKNKAQKFGEEVYRTSEHILFEIFETAKNAEDLKQQLTEFKKHLEEKVFGELAGKDGVIDLADLEKVEEASRQLNQFKDIDSAITFLENTVGSEMLKHKEWVNFLKQKTDEFANEAAQNSAEAVFVSAVNEQTKSNIKDFRQAKNHLRGFITDPARNPSIRDALRILQRVDDTVSGERAKLLEMGDVQPPEYRSMVMSERDLLLKRRLEPENINDRIVVEFMSANLAGRTMMLDNRIQRQALFQAIRTISQYYPLEYSEKYQRSIPQKAEALRTGYDLHHPTRHNRAARLKAIMTLAKEAEWVVGNIDKSEDWKKEGLADELKNTKAAEVRPKVDMGFRDRLKTHSTRFCATATREGFNGRSIGLGLAKGWLALTLTLNVFNYRKSFGGFLPAFEHLATNPYALAAAGGFWALKKHERTPEFTTSYLSEDAGGKTRIGKVYDGLNILNKDISRRKLLAFLGNGDEFEAMAALMKNPEDDSKKIKDYFTAIDKNRKKGELPTLTKKNVEELLIQTTGDKTKSKLLASQLPETTNDHIRYRFYKQFFFSKEIGSMPQFKADCASWT